MLVTSGSQNTPQPGAAVFENWSDPALSAQVVHFVGRQRGNTLLPSVVRHLSTEERLANILITGYLLAFPVYQSQNVPVVSVSDLSAAELETAFARGLNRRGRFEPWAIVLDRPRAWDVGFRPVLYADSERISEHRDALSRIYGPKGAALAVRTEMTTDDWTAEREWRYCFEPPTSRPWTVGDPPVSPPAQAGIDIRNGVTAVIVGRSDWSPGLGTGCRPAERWLWDADACRLIHDGSLPS